MNESGAEVANNIAPRHASVETSNNWESSNIMCLRDDRSGIRADKMETTC